MNIGDKVRLIHSKEEGIITRFLKGDVVEVEIEKGFKLPILKRELAIISKTEGQYFRTADFQSADKPIINKTSTVKSEKGIFLAFLQQNEKEISVFVINNTDFELPFSLTLGSEKTHRGLIGGVLKPKSFQKSQIDLAIKDFEEWGSFTFQAFYYSFGFFNEKQPLIKKLRLRANTFFNQKKLAPILEKEAYLFQLDAENQPFTVNPTELKEKMFEKIPENSVIKPIPKPSSIIDLHIENLTKNVSGLDNAQMLNVQINFFEQNLEKGIASGLDEMIFIHGVGNGVLKNEIQKRLSNHKNVAWFQDAQKEKFGYGATKLKIK